MHVAPLTLSSFNGDVYEDIKDWINRHERVTWNNKRTPDQRLQNAYFSLEGTAGTWYENLEGTIITWEACKHELRRAFATQQRRESAEKLLRAMVQGTNENMVSFVKDVLRLSIRVDPKASETKKLSILKRTVNENIFGGLVRSPPATVRLFLTKATNV